MEKRRNLGPQFFKDGLILFANIAFFSSHNSSRKQRDYILILFFFRQRIPSGVIFAFVIREIFRRGHEFAYSLFVMDLRDDIPVRRGFQSCFIRRAYCLTILRFSLLPPKIQRLSSRRYIFLDPLAGLWVKYLSCPFSLRENPHF